MWDFRVDSRLSIACWGSANLGKSVSDEERKVLDDAQSRAGRKGHVFVLYCALRQWRRCNIALSTTQQVPDCLNSVKHLQPKCLEDRFLPLQSMEHKYHQSKATSVHVSQLGNPTKRSDDLHSRRRTTKKTHSLVAHLTSPGTRDLQRKMTAQSCSRKRLTSSKNKFQTLCSPSSSEEIMSSSSSEHTTSRMLHRRWPSSGDPQQVLLVSVSFRVTQRSTFPAKIV